MRVLPIVLFVVASGLFISLIWIYFQLFTGEDVEFEAYANNISSSLPSTSTQFYPNMRYPDRVIFYTISANCGEKQRADFIEATRILERKTLLEFEPLPLGKDAPFIEVSCAAGDDSALESTGYYVAGEGGPTKIVNTTRYAVILGGRISLFREEHCNKPQVALHELLHALGFDHKSDKKSIMFPITNCNQVLDNDIVAEINRLYSQPSAPDLYIEKIEANKTGPFLNFKIVVGNSGLKDVQNSTLEVRWNGQTLGEFSLEDIPLGTKRFLEVSNFRIPRDAFELEFFVLADQKEITTRNNKIRIRRKETSA